MERIRSHPKDFGWDELKRLLSAFGYVEEPGAALEENLSTLIDVFSSAFTNRTQPKRSRVIRSGMC
jgi:hypothetical protein